MRVDASTGTLDILVDDLDTRPLATADLSDTQAGTGRELFTAFRNAVGAASDGASIF